MEKVPRIVKSFRERKLTEYSFENGLLCFWHGLGDLLMFLPAWEALRERYPLTLGLQPGVGQEELVPEAIVLDKPLESYSSYDYVFVVSFPMSEGSSQTKLDKCLRDEIGHVVFDHQWRLPVQYGTRIVGVNFQGTCLPESTNPSEAVCKQIWDEIVSAGYVPLEIMFHHKFHNPKNMQYQWITATTREAKATVSNLVGVISGCCAFIGVASGPWILARNMLDKVLFIEMNHKCSSYTDAPCDKISGLSYRNGLVTEWLTET